MGQLSARLQRIMWGMIPYLLVQHKYIIMDNWDMYLWECLEVDTLFVALYCFTSLSQLVEINLRDWYVKLIQNTGNRQFTHEGGMDGLARGCNNFRASAMESMQPCTMPVT